MSGQGTEAAAVWQADEARAGLTHFGDRVAFTRGDMTDLAAADLPDGAGCDPHLACRP